MVHFNINDKTPAFVFANGAVCTTRTLSNKIEIVAVEGNLIESDGTGSPVLLQGRPVYLSGFYIGKYEMIYAQWYEVKSWAGSNGYTFANQGREGHDGPIGASPTSGNTEPVTYINWRDMIVLVQCTLGEGRINTMLYIRRECDT